MGFQYSMKPSSPSLLTPSKSFIVRLGTEPRNPNTGRFEDSAQEEFAAAAKKKRLASTVIFAPDEAGGEGLPGTKDSQERDLGAKQLGVMEYLHV